MVSIFLFLDMDGAAWSRHGVFSAPHFGHAFCVCQGIHEYVYPGQIVIPPMTSPTLFPLGGGALQWAWANQGGGGGRRLLRAGGGGGAPTTT